MKQYSANIRRTRHHRIYNRPMHPNAADNLYFSRKAEEILGGILFSAGFSTLMLFFVALS